MAWDVSSDADFHKSLDWIEEFVADELIPWVGRAAGNLSWLR
jgi:hypothetical protein